MLVKTLAPATVGPGAAGGATVPGRIVVIKSTVPVGTGDLVEQELRSRTGHLWDVASNPEFLREGSALHDFLHPDHVVIGAGSQGAAGVVRSLYSWVEAPIVLTDRRTAELIKYVANAYLATGSAWRVRCWSTAGTSSIRIRSNAVPNARKVRA